MYTVKIRNSKNKTLQLYPSTEYMLVGMTGITPSDGIITMAEMPTQDGARFNSSRVQSRNLIVNFDIRGEGEIVRQRRINLYKYIKTKQPVRMYVANDQRSAYIDGYVERLDDAGTIFSDRERLQLSIICPDPYFRDNDTGEQVITFSSTIPVFKFPFGIDDPIPISVRSTDYSKVITNNGDTETGIIITVKAVGAVENPVIYNQSTGETMTFDIEMLAGDELVINTIRGEKSVKRIRNGATTNVLNLMAPGSDWITFTVGANQFYYSASSGTDNIQLTFSFTELYEGI